LADISEKVDDIVADLKQANMWGNIRRLAEKDPYIKEQLDKIIVYYRLKYEQRRR
jgi:hypothetical protein